MTQSASASARSPRALFGFLRADRPPESLQDLLIRGFTVALLLVAGILLFMGLPFYLTPVEERQNHELYHMFASGRPVGLILGIIGTFLMVALLLYSVRKWIPAFSFMGTSRTWMAFHVACGTLAPLFILLHSAIQWPYGFTGIGFWCMVLVSLSGVFGRHLFGYFPQGAANLQQDLSRRQQELTSVRTDLVSATAGKSADQVARAVALAMDLEIEPKTLGELVVLDAESRHRADVIRILLYRARLPATLRERAERTLVEQLDLRRRRAGFDVARRLLRYWNLLHQPLALAMYLIAAVHIFNAIVFAGSLNVLFGGQ